MLNPQSKPRIRHQSEQLRIEHKGPPVVIKKAGVRARAVDVSSRPLAFGRAKRQKICEDEIDEINSIQQNNRYDEENVFEFSAGIDEA